MSDRNRSADETSEIMNKKVIARSSGYISVLDPYNIDTFVKSEYSEDVNIDQKYGEYLKFINIKSDISKIIKEVIAYNKKLENSIPLCIIDCGVFMGTFSVAAGLVAADAGAETRQYAYEANQALIDPIRMNFAGYGLDIAVHNNGVSGAKGTLEFAHSSTGIIGGSLIGAADRGSEYTKQVCEVLPLSDILDDHETLSVIKLDIEGSETGAFNSISDDRRKLSNVFIVEYAPWQGAVKLDNGQTYNEFLICNFDILDLKNWMFSQAAVIDNVTALERIVENQPSRPNSDIALIPKGAGQIFDNLKAQCLS